MSSGRSPGSRSQFFGMDLMELPAMMPNVALGMMLKKMVTETALLLGRLQFLSMNGSPGLVYLLRCN